MCKKLPENRLLYLILAEKVFLNLGVCCVCNVNEFASGNVLGSH